MPTRGATTLEHGRLAIRTRRAEVGAPQDAPRLRREGVDGVVRGGDHHASIGDERLAEDAAVERGARTSRASAE